MILKIANMKRLKNRIFISKNKEAISYIEMKVSESANTTSTEISIKLKNMTEEFAMKGTLQSGIFITATTNLIDHTITESCKSLLDAIEGLQSKWNITYSKKNLESISELIITRYQGLIESVYRNNYQKVISTAKPPSRSSDLQFNLLSQGINGMVTTKIKEIQLHNKLQKDEPDVKEAKKANYIAIIALIISVVSLYFSLKK